CISICGSIGIRIWKRKSSGSWRWAPLAWTGCTERARGTLCSPTPRAICSAAVPNCSSQHLLSQHGWRLMSNLRFCAYQYQHLPLDSLTERWREAERRGFDVLWNCDTLVEPDHPRHLMFDGPATLTLMAERTRTIRIGTL